MLKKHVATIIGASILAATYSAARYLTARRQPDPADSPAAYGLPFKAVYFLAADRIRLHGWWIPVDYAQGTIVQCAGQNGSMDSDLPTATMLHNAGFNILMFNWRAHGKSGGHAVTFGWNEANDLLGALDYLENQRQINRVGVLGFSMGAITAMRATNQSENIACIVADGAIGQLDNTLVEWLAEKHIPRWLARPFVWLLLLLGSLQTGAPLYRVNGIRWTQGLQNCPVLFIHGENDNLVPMSDINNMVANTESELWIAPGCKHREAHVLHPDEYQRRVISWFSQYLN